MISGRNYFSIKIPGFGNTIAYFNVFDIKEYITNDPDLIHRKIFLASSRHISYIELATGSFICNAYNMLDVLLSEYVDINTLNRYDLTIFHVRNVGEIHPETERVLRKHISKFEKFHILDSIDNTVVDIAAYEGDYRRVKLFLDHINDPELLDSICHKALACLCNTPLYNKLSAHDDIIIELINRIRNPRRLIDWPSFLPHYILNYNEDEKFLDMLDKMLDKCNLNGIDIRYIISRIIRKRKLGEEVISKDTFIKMTRLIFEKGNVNFKSYVMMICRHFYKLFPGVIQSLDDNTIRNIIKVILNNFKLDDRRFSYMISFVCNVRDKLLTKHNNRSALIKYKVNPLI